MFERRRQRSEVIPEAVHLQLSACAARYEVGSMALGDSRGLLVGAAGQLTEADEALVAFAPLLCRSVDSQKRRSLVRTLRTFVPRASHRMVSVRHFRVGDERLYLCAMGERTGNKEIAIYSAIQGLRRILDAD